MVVIIVLVGFLEKRLITDIIYSEKGLCLSPEVRRLFIGDSHIMCAIDDSIIPNSFNASRNSESLFQTYNKLNHILKNNPQIKEVYVGFAPHNVSVQANKLILYGDRYFPLMDNESRELIKNANQNGLLTANRASSIKHQIILHYLTTKYSLGLLYNLNEAIDFLSGDIYAHPVFTKPYKSRFTNIGFKTTKEIILRHFQKDCNSSTIMFRYICKMDSVCDVKGVRLCLLNTPVHKSYVSMIPKCHSSSYYQLVNKLKENLNITYIDLKDNIHTDSLFGDGDHLNYNGRKVFSISFSKLIKENAF